MQQRQRPDLRPPGQAVIRGTALATEVKNDFGVLFTYDYFLESN
jgi:hypothetical protein